MVTSNTINSIIGQRLLKVLLDSDLRQILIHTSALTRGIVTNTLNKYHTLSTLGSKVTTSKMVTLRDLCLSEFNKNRRGEQQKALVVDHSCCYNIILVVGTNFFNKTGISTNHKIRFIEWYKYPLSLRYPFALISEAFDIMEDSLCVHTHQMNSLSQIGQIHLSQKFWMQNTIQPTSMISLVNKTT